MLLGGFTMLAMTSKIEDVVELKLGEAYVLGDADEAYWSSGARKTTVTQEGYFDDAVNGIHEALKDLSVVALPMSIAPHGNVNGRKIDIYQSVQRVGYVRQATVGDITKANGEYGIYYGKVGGYIVHALGSEGAAGNSDTLDVDLGTQPMTANGGAIVLHVTELSGCTNCTITLRHSSDGISYTDKQACSPVTPANVPADAAAGQYVTFTGTLNRYVSASWAYTGASGPSVTFMLGVYPAP
jgi:hypothetical protein